MTAARTAERRLIELWRHGSKPCLITPPDGEAPFLVKVLEVDSLVDDQAFNDHHAACAAAVHALRHAVAQS